MDFKRSSCRKQSDAQLSWAAYVYRKWESPVWILMGRTGHRVLNVWSSGVVVLNTLLLSQLWLGGGGAETAGMFGCCTGAVNWVWGCAFWFPNWVKWVPCKVVWCLALHTLQPLKHKHWADPCTALKQVKHRAFCWTKAVLTSSALASNFVQNPMWWFTWYESQKIQNFGENFGGLYIRGGMGLNGGW